MEKIAISTRMTESSHGEWRDCLSQDWTSYLWNQGFQTVLVPNHLASCREYLRDAVLLILSGGDDLQLLGPHDVSDHPRTYRDRTEFALLDDARSKNLPVMGVCRGMDVINAYYGGATRPIRNRSHVAVEHDVTVNENALGGAFGRTKMRVNSFHNQEIATLGNHLEVVARAADGCIEGVQHESLSITGVQWHPERTFSDSETAEGHVRLIRRLVEKCFSRRQ